VSYYSTVLESHLGAARRQVWSDGTPATDRMSPTLDDLTIRFATYARNSKLDVLDIGCGDGIATAAVLQRGGHVLAVDANPGALHQVLARVPSEQYRRLKVRVGRVPTLDFKFAHFAAIHVARVFHLLTPTELQVSLKKFYRWAYPSGKLFLSALTPAGAFWEPLETEIARRKSAQEQWPGYIEDVTRFIPAWNGQSASVHLIDHAVMRREIEAAGFEIEHLSSYPLPWDHDQVCLAVVARCGPAPS
jgi:ubiquinone/menaquinone biosynthesis C-methylase UbiE